MADPQLIKLSIQADFMVRPTAGYTAVCSLVISNRRISCSDRGQDSDGVVWYSSRSIRRTSCSDRLQESIVCIVWCLCHSNRRTSCSDPLQDAALCSLVISNRRISCFDRRQDSIVCSLVSRSGAFIGPLYFVGISGLKNLCNNSILNDVV